MAVKSRQASLPINPSLSACYTQTVRQLVFQAVTPTTDLPANQPASQSVNQPAGQSVNQPASQSVNQPANQPASQAVNQSVNQPASQTINKPVKVSVIQPPVRLIRRLTSWRFGRLIDGLAGWLAGWSTD